MRSLNLARGLRAAMTAVWLVSASHALDPNRAMSQYIRQQWTVESEFPGGTVHAISQTPDGYLWIGTDTGLIRFDGFNFQAVQYSPLISTPNTPVLGLTTDVDGNLLIRLQGAGVLRQRNGRIETVATGVAPGASQVTAMWRDEGGRILMSDLVGGTRRVQREKVEELAKADLLPGSSPIISLASTPDGKVWLGTLNSGLFSLTHGQATNVSTGFPYKKINCLLPVSADEVWVGTDSGTFRWNGARFIPVAVPRSLGNVQVLTLLRDRDGNVWVGTAQGLLRLNPGGTSFSDEKDLRGEGGIDALFEDREGNIWVGGARGLERIRESAFVTYSQASGLPSERGGPVYVDAENRTWFAPAEGGLYWFSNGPAQPIREAGLEKDVVYSIAGQKGGIWVGRQHGGLTRLRYEKGRVTSKTYTEVDGLAQNSVYAVYQGRNGAVWAGTINRGASKLEGGRFVTYTTASGLSSNTIYSIVETRDGATWLATPNGLNAWSEGHWRIYSSKDGLPSDNVNCLFEDSSNVLWIGTSGGLASMRSGQIQVFHEAPDSLHKQILGLAEDTNGWLWIATSNRVLRVRRDKLSDGRLEEGDVREYGTADGLRSTEGLRRTSSVVADSLGRIWFSLSRGISVVDTAHLKRDSMPAIAHLEVISADGVPVSLGSSIRIPHSRKRITFGYTGLSLAVPERLRFRYFLDNFDRTWSQPTASREAVYTNLTPGPYRFRVVASNSDGLWNGAETVVPFDVDPAFWQTWWFRLLGVLITGLAILIFFRLRVLSLTRQMNIRLEERVGERTRIAQDLHDTLLQGVLSASMQLNVANDQMASDAPGKALVVRVLDLMGQVIEDGRSAVRGMRFAEGMQNLDQAFSRIPQELPVQSSANFRVLVEGTARSLHPVIRDEVYRIGREAITNAFRHSRATRIEVELEYGLHELRVLVRDNGCGIDPHLLRSGKDGHWGLSGMRERAERVGAKLKVWSSVAGGTEVDLRVPGRIAFDSQTPGNVAKWLSKIYARKPGSSESGRDRRVG